MSELPKPEVLDTTMVYEARVHMVTIEHGTHSQLYIPVEEPSTSATLERLAARSESINHDRELAWIDFAMHAVVTVLHTKEETLRGQTFYHPDTFVATNRHGKFYEFKNTEELLQLEPENFPAYTAQWMQRFLPYDLPNPPRNRDRTGDIAWLATKLPPRTTEDIINIALQKVPSIRSYYEEHGIDVSAIR